MTLLDRYSGDIAAAGSMPADQTDQAVKKLADTVYSAFTETCGNSVQRGTHTGTFPEDPNTTLPEINLTGDYTRCDDIPAGLHQMNPDGFIEMDADNANPVLKSGAAANFCGPVVFKNNEAYLIDGDKKHITVFIDFCFTEEHYSGKSYPYELYTTHIYKTGGGAYDWFTLAGDSGTPQLISDKDTMRVLGGDGIATVASANDTVTVNMDMTDTEAAWNDAQDLAISHDFIVDDGDTKIKLFIDADAGQLAASYNAGAIQVLGHDASGDWVWVDTTTGCA